MDLGFYIIASLLGAGYTLNQQKQTRHPDETSHLKREQPNGTNILNSRDYFRVSKEEAEKVVENWEASKDPVTTNIIPMYYNTLHLSQQDIDKVPNANFQKGLIYSVVDSFDDKTKALISSKSQKYSPRRVLNDGERYQEPEWGVISGRPSSSKLTTDHGMLEQIGGSLLPDRGYEDFTHNNMVPFYGGTIKQNVDSDNRLGAQKLEVFTGQFKLNQDQKKEVEPFFAPTYGMTNIYGSVEHRDMSRYIPSNTGKKNNELPFEQVKVGPGLNKGFTAEPSGGFHPFLRVLPKTKGELRVDPVFEQEGRVNPGKSRIQKRTLIQQMYKNKPELLVENKNGERNFTTVGAIKGRKLRPTIILRDTHRKKSRFQLNPAIASTKKNYVAPKTRVSRRVNFFNTPFRNAFQASGKKVNDYGKSGYRNRLNERAVTGTRAHLLNPKTWVNSISAYFTDAAKKTRKQHYINNVRPNGNAKPQRPSALPAYDPRQRAKTTIRETTENFDHLGNVNSSWKKQPAYDPRQRAKTTIRETTENKEHNGWLKKLAGRGPAYNTTREGMARTTVKETTENSKYLGHALGSWKKHIAYDPRDRARTTVKETTENFDHLGIVGTVQKKQIAYDPNDRAKTTVKETTEKDDHLGIVGSIRKKHIAYDPKDRAKTTIKETTEDGKYLGAPNRQVAQNGKGYMTTNWYANNTNRQFTADYEYTGVADSKSKKMKSYDDAYNAQVNTEKEKIAVGRAPTTQKYKVPIGPSNINIEVKKMEEDQLNQRSAVKTSNIGNYFNPQAISHCTITSEKNSLPQYDTRLDTSILDAYKKNPLTQSLNSYY